MGNIYKILLGELEKVIELLFYGEKLLDPRPTPKLDDHSLPAVRDCF
jgi:hypothetical protein